MRYLFTLALIIMSLNGYSQGYNGLIARWPFNGNANDVSGNGLNGTVTNATLDTGYNGLPNNAYHFNGTSSSISVPYNSLMNVTNFSICALVKPEGFYSGPCQTNVIMWRNTDGPRPDHYGLHIFDNDYDNDCNVYSPDHEVFAGGANNWDNEPNSAWIDNPVQLNTWYCVVATCNTDSTFLYVNGALTKSFPTLGPNTSSAIGISIGANIFDSQFPYWFNGKIDEIRLYNRTLSQNEVYAFCDSASQIPSTVTNTTLSDEVSIYPNPAHDNIIVSFPQTGYTGNVQLINSLGQVLSTQNINRKLININLSNLPVGLYFVKCEYSGITITRKIIKE